MKITCKRTNSSAGPKRLQTLLLPAVVAVAATLWALAAPIVAAQAPAFGRHHIPEQPFVPDMLEQANTSPGMGLGFYYSSPGGDGYPAPPFLSTTDFLKLHELLTGEGHHFHRPGEAEQSGPHYLIAWPTTDLPEVVAETTDENNIGAQVLARIQATMQVADGRRTIVNIPVYTSGEQPVGYNEILVDGSIAKGTERAISGGLLSFTPGQVQRRRIQYWRAGELTELSWAKGEPAGNPGALPRVSLKLPIARELFSILSAEWPAGTSAETHDLAVSGISPAAIRHLPADKKGRARLLVLPGFDSLQAPTIELIWAPKGAISSPAVPVKSLVENTYLVGGPTGKLISERTYDFPDAAAFSDGIKILHASNLTFTSIRTEPACHVSAENPGVILIRPQDPGLFEDNGVIRVRLEANIEVSMIDRTRFPNLQDASYCVSENFHFERPGHIAVSFFVAHGVSVIPEAERPAPMVKNHIVGDSFASLFRRTGYSTLEAFVRTTMVNYQGIRHDVTLNIKDNNCHVSDIVHFGTNDKPTSAPKNIYLWMPFLTKPEEVTLNLAENNSPTTQTLENNILSLSWDSAPLFRSLTLNYTVPFSAVQQPQRIAPPFLKLPIALGQGVNHRIYRAKIVYEGEEGGILYRGNDDDWWRHFTTPTILAQKPLDMHADSKENTNPDKLSGEAWPLNASPETTLELRCFLEGNLKEPPRWPIIQVFDKVREIKRLDLIKE